MRIPENLGFILLAIWLILIGLDQLGVDFGPLTVVLGLIAVIAGILILIWSLGRRGRNI